jgi:hypothetical protein
MTVDDDSLAHGSLLSDFLGDPVGELEALDELKTSRGEREGGGRG